MVPAGAGAPTLHKYNGLKNGFSNVHCSVESFGCVSGWVCVRLCMSVCVFVHVHVCICVCV